MRSWAAPGGMTALVCLAVLSAQLGYDPGAPGGRYLRDVPAGAAIVDPGFTPRARAGAPFP